MSSVPCSDGFPDYSSFKALHMKTSQILLPLVLKKLNRST